MSCDINVNVKLVGAMLVRGETKVYASGESKYEGSREYTEGEEEEEDEEEEKLGRPRAKPQTSGDPVSSWCCSRLLKYLT